jgi:hypothetical protein
MVASPSSAGSIPPEEVSMVERRWLLRLVPPGLAVGAAGLALAGTIGAYAGAWDPPPCPGGRATLARALQAPGPASVAELRETVWYTLDPRLDERGELSAQWLRIGFGAARARHVELPPESWASGPYGRVVLVAADDGAASRLVAFDGRAGCRWDLGTSRDVIRRAVIDARGEVHEFRVARQTRADLGIWRRGTAGDPPVNVLAALPGDGRVGRTFTTSLSWSDDGRLAVQSCGAVICRTRLFEPRTGRTTPVPGDHGELIGVMGDRVATYAPCLGLPCPVLVADLVTGTTTELAHEAGLATIVPTGDGPRLVTEGPAGLEVRLPDGTRETVLADGERPDRLMPGPERALAGTLLAPGWVVRSPDGRSPDGAWLTRLSDGTTVPVAEVIR